MIKKLKKSPINYFSDLFVAAMVVAWIIATIIMMAAAIYATTILADTSIWCEVASLVSEPVTSGGAIWMLKNAVQHAIANNRGEKCPMDFPAVNTCEEIDGQERPMERETEETEETEETKEAEETEEVEEAEESESRKPHRRRIS